MYKIFTSTTLFFFLSFFAVAAKPDLPAEERKSYPDTNKVLLFKKLSQQNEYSKPDSAIFLAHQGLKLSRELKFRKGEAMMLSQLGSINEKHDNLPLAQTFLNEALLVFQEVNDQQGIAGCYNALGIIQGKLGNYKPATTYFLKALKIYENIENKAGIIQSYIKLGVVNEHGNNLNKALQYYFKAQKLNIDKKSNSYLTLYNNIGIVYARKGQLKKALTYFEEGIKNSKENPAVDVLTSLLDNAGNASLELGFKAKAIAYYQEALNKSRTFNLPEKEARSLLNISYVLGDGNSSTSLNYLNEALLISKKIGNKRLTSEIYTTISDFYKSRKDFKAAFSALEHHNLYADSLFSLDKKLSVAALQSGYDMEKSRVEIQTLQLINGKQVLERDIFIIGSLFTVFLIIGMVLYILKVTKLNKQLTESNAIKDKLFSIIGHDLRTPVINLVQMMDMMEDMDVSSNERTVFIAAIKKQSEASLETLDNLLHWGKNQLQGIRVKPDQLLLKSVFEKNLYAFDLQRNKKSINIVNHIPELIKVLADADHLNFIIRNLISNAIKFTFPSGTIEINAVRKDADFVTISVCDNGIGISDENKLSIFNTFPVVKNGTDNEKGTGIGLMLCKEFVEANGGLIWLKSNPENGTTIYFTLPMIK